MLKYNLSSFINDCIIIEKNIKDINKINGTINLNKNIRIGYNIDQEEINNLINTIKNLDKIITNNNIFDDFKIENKNPYHKITYHSDGVYCLYVLNDRRLVSCFKDTLIILYNKHTYQPDLIIIEHSDNICCIIQLSPRKLASCSDNKKIKIYNIKG